MTYLICCNVYHVYAWASGCSFDLKSYAGLRRTLGLHFNLKGQLMNKDHENLEQLLVGDDLWEYSTSLCSFNQPLNVYFLFVSVIKLL